ncbi:MAG: flagellar motor switch protein FliM [Verrucomicrobiota bacterium]
MDENDIASEVLSQNEVEDILASITDDSDSEIRVISKKGTSTRKSQVEDYDYRGPVFLGAGEMRRLRIKNEEFIRSLASTLSVYLRSDFGLQMSRLETVTYQTMLDNLPMPSHLTLFKLLPLNGICLMDVSPRLGLTVLDRMMGGPGHSIKNERDFTDIEVHVLQDFISLILKEFADSWHKYITLKHEIVDHENTARFLNIVQPDEVMLYLEMEARIGDCLAGIRFMIPYHMLEGAIAQLMKEISNEEEEKSAAQDSMRLNLPYKNIPIQLKTFWRGHSMTLQELQNLQKGDVLLLDNKTNYEVDVQLGKKSKFKGEVDLMQEPLAVTLISKLDNNDER